MSPRPNEPAEAVPLGWINRHPFLLALVVLLAVVIPGFVRIQNVNSQLQAQADQLQAQADRNTALVTCQVQYAAALTDALQDRDSVNATARAASTELWDRIRYFITHPTGTAGPLLAAIDRYDAILDRVSRTARLNPYPDIEACLGAIPGMDAQVVAGFQLVSADRRARYDSYCLGRPVTIRGTYGSDVIHGTDGPDVIFAYYGDDLIIAGKGNDRICARGGDDTVNAGQDYDRVDCGAGMDYALQAEATTACE